MTITTELILGGQKSGKSRRAELLARDWLAQSSDHSAVLIATGQAWDEEMRERIARHQRDRAERVPGLRTVEEPRDVAAALTRLSTPHPRWWWTASRGGSPAGPCPWVWKP